jgi:hypothetical protein
VKEVDLVGCCLMCAAGIFRGSEKSILKMISGNA